MDKKIEDYLHLYLGCKVQIVRDIEEEFSEDDFIAPKVGEIGELIMVNDGMTINCGSESEEWNYGISFEKSKCALWDTRDFKLILRPLSDMTEEEIHELETAMWGNWEDPKLGDKESVLKMFINDSSHDRPGYEITVKATNWLRKNGFDVDSLLESGLAIDKKTLK